MDGGFKKYFNTMDKEKVEFLYKSLSKVEDFFKKIIAGK
jgi:hypothetical protein